ncbi:ATP-binding cassette domain-containing protein [Rheinheimera sp. UJ63]|uniref:ATP-binding cassette domain-containing protein n=1 Tax=Rheinheimera sp. UJ63 TaxID=2910157 RepID=UPI001F23C9B7|nr:ABC transporter ATP-binding protein [Rheinheimera sp. UJ63]MCF4009292.1 ABC transporter ATP-binding protein/permease [Rheinheimera sp. UJ63]
MFFNQLKQYIRYLIATSGRQLVVGFCLLLIAAITEGLGLFMLLPLLGALTGDSSVTAQLPAVFQTLPQLVEPAILLLLFFLLLCFRAGIIFVRENYMALIRLHSSDQLRATLFNAMLHSRWQYSSQVAHEQIIEQLTTGMQRVGMATFYVLKIATSAILIITYLFVALKLAPMAVLLALLLGGGTLFFLRGINHNALNLGESLTQTQRQLYNRVLFYLNGLKTIKTFQQESVQASTFAQQQLLLRDNQLNYQRKSGRNQFLFSIITAAVVCIMAYGGLFWLTLPLATLTLLVVIFIRLMPLLLDMQNSLQRLLHTLPAFTDIHQSLMLFQRHAESGNATVNLAAPQVEIALRDACYRYPSGRGVSHVSLYLPVGEITLLQGPSGSGKTTIADILSGLVNVQQGQLCLDGKALDDLALLAWRQQVIYITQEPFLFDATIRDNIVWGSAFAGQHDTDEQLRDICEQAAATFIFSLPEGLDTTVGERGIALSGGQRQRVILARALCRKPSLLILDEASNALDNQTEQIWLDNLKQLTPHITVLLISHKEDAAQWADHIVEVKQENINAK